MPTENRHITRIEDTYANFKTSGDNGQSCITTDNSDWIYYDDGGTELYKAARQYYDDGSINYLANDFGQVTLHDDLLVNEYIKRAGGTDDRIRFENDKITIDAGGVTALTIEDDQVYSALQKFGFGVTPEDWNTSFTAVQFGGQGALIGDVDALAAYTIEMLGNAYYDRVDARYEYIFGTANTAATRYQQQAGVHRWHVAPVGTADNEITWKEMLEISQTTVVFNEDSEAVVYRFETDNETHGFYMSDTEVYSNIDKWAIGKTSTESWSATLTSLQLGGTVSFFTQKTEAASSEFFIAQNIYFDGAFKRYVTDEASQYLQVSGGHKWYCDTSGSKDAGFTPTLRMSIIADGKIAFGPGTPDKAFCLTAGFLEDADSVLKIRDVQAQTGVGSQVAAILVDYTDADGSSATSKIIPIYDQAPGP